MPHETRIHQDILDELDKLDLVTLLDQYDLFEIKSCNRCTTPNENENSEIINEDDNPYLSVFVKKFIQQTKQALQTFYNLQLVIRTI